jgi:hypothetical protein
LSEASRLKCGACGRAFALPEQVACISGTIMGDECTDCYYWCEACGVYTMRLYRDVFTGPEVSHDSSPLSREEGNRRIALIRSCPEPYDGRCRCPAHVEYFGEWLD